MSENVKDVGGRPKKGLDLLPNDWEDRVIELYSEGASNVEVKAYLHTVLGTFSDSLWFRWMKEEELFSSTIKRGLALSKAWWERKGRISLDNPKFQTGLYQINMRNRFGWDEKKENEKENTRKNINVNVYTTGKNKVLNDIVAKNESKGK